MKEFLPLLLIAGLLTACVSTQKYNALAVSKEYLQKDYNQLLQVQKEKQRLSDSLTSVSANLTAVNLEKEDWKTRYGSVFATNADLTRQLDALRSRQNEIVQTTVKDKDALQKQLEDRANEIDKKEKELRLLEASMKSSKGTLDEVKNSLSDREKKIRELSDALKEKDAQTALIRQKITDALTDYAPGDLTIRQENGKIYLTLSQGLLFAKGSAAIEGRGAEAIRKIAPALNAKQDMEINVEGHTDSDGNPDLNWKLSAERAQNVAKILIGAGVEPKRIIASGRASFRPVAPNDTEANKSKNRRTEIILSPKLDELYNLVKTN